MTGKQMILVVVVNALISALIALALIFVLVLPAVNELSPPSPTPVVAVVATRAMAVDEAEPTPESVVHVVKGGDTISGLALKYGVSTDDIAAANRLENPDFLRAGMELIIPLGGVPQITATIAPVPTSTETPLPFEPPSALTATASALGSATEPAPIPIPTLPQEGELRIEIAGIIGAGDLSQERAIVTNVGDRFADMDGWILSDADGNSYTFSRFRLWPGGNVAVYTRSGQDGNPPASFFWNKLDPVWTTGDEATITDAGGKVIASHTLGP